MRCALSAMVLAFGPSIVQAEVLSAGTTIRHPAYLGTVEPNVVSIPDRDGEAIDSLPAGTLSDEAVLFRVEPQTVCIGLRLRNRSSDARASDLRHWRPILVVGGGEIHFPTVTAFRVLRRRFDRSGPADTSYPGEDFGQAFTQFGGRAASLAIPGALSGPASRALGFASSAAGADHEPWDPVSFAIGGGVVCFANNGSLNPATPELALRLEPSRVDGDPLEFVWRFTFPPPGTPVARIGPPPTARRARPPRPAGRRPRGGGR